MEMGRCIACKIRRNVASVTVIYSERILHEECVKVNDKIFCRAAILPSCEVNVSAVGGVNIEQSSMRSIELTIGASIRYGHGQQRRA